MQLLKINPNGSRLLNLGCGNTFHPSWINIDFHDHNGSVIAYDLNLGIPFADETVDVIYHSHLLEHFSRQEGKKFLEECFRTLRPGGLIRIVVPDLATIAKTYLSSLEEATYGGKEELERHEWMTIEFIDQMTRTHPGGEMANFWLQDPVPQESFIASRSGQEFYNFKNYVSNTNIQKKVDHTALPLLDTNFYLSGELHKWMYDAVSLYTILSSIGFVDISEQKFNTSLDKNIILYGLDVSNNGLERKPDSLYIEAKKNIRLDKDNKIKVSIFSTSDLGGAGIACLRHHSSLQHTNISTEMYVARQNTYAKNLHTLPNKNRVARVGLSGSAEIVSLKMGESSKEVSKYKNRPHGLEIFSTTSQCADLSTVPFLEDFDIINLHWITDFLDISSSLNILKKYPIVWTLHDMRPFTGGCHYAGDCKKYMKHCGSCPQLGSSDPSDLSFNTWKTSKSAYRQLDMHIVTPSQWLAERAQESSLFRRFPVHVIPHSQPLNIFNIKNKSAMRQSLGFSNDELILAFAAQQLDNQRKGLHYLLACLKKVAAGPLKEKVHLMLLGNKSPSDFFNLGIKATSFGHIDDPNILSILYNASDAVIVPSLEDNSPNVICEAAGCGTPVLAFAAGGIPEMIRHKETGWLAPIRDVDALVEGIYWLAESRKDPLLARRCRVLALEKWNEHKGAKLYEQLFLSLKNETYKIRNESKVPTPTTLPETIPSSLIRGEVSSLTKSINTTLLCEQYRHILDINMYHFFDDIPWLGMYRCESTGLLEYAPKIFATSDIYTKFNDYPWHTIKEKKDFSVIDKYINNNDHILDINFGNGVSSSQFNFKMYSGIDCFQKCRTLNYKEHQLFLNMSIEEFSENNINTYDIVCAFQILEYVEYPLRFLEACFSCLKKGGKLFISVPSEDSFTSLIPNYIINMPPFCQTRWTDNALKTIAKIFNCHSHYLIPDFLQPLHIKLYSEGLAEYFAYKHIGVDSFLTSIKAHQKIEKIKNKYINGLVNQAVNFNTEIRGHDVLALYVK